MPSSDTLSQALFLLSAAGTGAAKIGQGVATRVLGDLVAARLQRDGFAKEWEEFKRNPQNDSLVRHVIRQALQADPDFRGRNLP